MYRKHELVKFKFNQTIKKKIITNNKPRRKKKISYITINKKYIEREFFIIALDTPYYRLL